MADGRTGRDADVPERWDGAFMEAFRPRPVDPAPSSDGPPDDEGRYEVGDEVGRGGVGIVYRGRDRSLDRDVALKILRLEHVEDEGLVRRFVEEARIGGRLEHPGVVPVYGMGMPAGGRPSIAMKLVEGETMAARLKRGAKLHELLPIFERVAQTVAYAHHRGVIHRDLKPGNVMVGAFGETLVVDWGFAKVLGQADGTTRAGEVVGTPGYMAPEQARGEVDAHAGSADVFSLGAILCRLLTGRPPVTGDATEAWSKTRDGRLDEAGERLDACGAPADLVGLAKRCLTPEKEGRPTANEVARRVGEHLADVEDRARRAEIEAVSADAAAARERRRRRLALTLAALVVAGVVAGGLVRRHRSLVREAHASETVERVADALRTVTEHETAGRWAAAVASAGSALALARARGADPDTIRRTEGRLEGAERAAAEAGQAVARDRRHAALLSELHEMRVAIYDNDSMPDALELDVLIRGLLRRHGVDIEAGTPHEVGARLRASAHADEIATTLAEWAVTSLALEVPERRRLLEIVASTDPDLRWAELHEVLEMRDIDALLGFARSLVEERARTPLLVVTARALSRFGRRGAAMMLLHTAHAVRPDDVLIVRALAYQPSSLKNASTGPARFRTTLVALRPDSARARTDLGWILGFLGAPEEAITLVREAIRLDPSHARAHSVLGLALVRSGKPVSGLAAAEKGARLAPHRFDTVGALALARYEAGDAEGAVEAFRAAIEILPGQPATRVYLARALIETGRYDEAEKEVRRALSASGRPVFQRRAQAVLEQIRALREEEE